MYPLTHVRPTQRTSETKVLSKGRIAVGGIPELGEVAWLANTPAGDAVAARLGARPPQDPAG